MFEYTGRIVRSEAGRDRGGLFLVLGEEDGYLFLADGKRRRVEKPKRKKPGHVSLAEREDAPAIHTPREGRRPLSNRELRTALAAFRAESRRV